MGKKRHSIGRVQGGLRKIASRNDDGTYRIEISGERPLSGHWHVTMDDVPEDRFDRLYAALDDLSSPGGGRP